MERDGDKRIAMSEAEAKTVRAALFIAIHHVDSTAGCCNDCFSTITGVDRSALPALMKTLDELLGHDAQDSD